MTKLTIGLVLGLASASLIGCANADDTDEGVVVAEEEGALPNLWTGNCTVTPKKPTVTYAASTGAISIKANGSFSCGTNTSGTGNRDIQLWLRKGQATDLSATEKQIGSVPEGSTKPTTSGSSYPYSVAGPAGVVWYSGMQVFQGTQESTGYYGPILNF